MKQSTEETLTTLYNLTLNPRTRDWERQQLETAKQGLYNHERLADTLAQLEAVLRPLATRHSLTPDVAEFYATLAGNSAFSQPFDDHLHFTKDGPFIERAIFAGGCFWCMVEPFETRTGILAVYSGYTGGSTANPSYEEVSRGQSGHVEAVEIIFDRRKISYQQLNAIYWQLIDPTDANGQINDRGTQYRPTIFYQNAEQQHLAEQAKQAEATRYHRPIVVEIQPAQPFWLAENYHQQFYQKEKQRYHRIERARKQYLLFLKMQNNVCSFFHKAK